MKKRYKVLFLSSILIILSSILIISAANVALNKQASAVYGESPNNAIDGDIYTQWNAGSNPGESNNANLSINLQGTFNVKNYTIHCAGDGGNNGTIYFYNGATLATTKTYSSCNYNNIYQGVSGDLGNINVTNVIINAIQSPDNPNVVEFELFQCEPDCSGGKCGTASNGCGGTCSNVNCGTGKSCNINICVDNPICTSNWTCGSWGMCNVSNKSTRNCTDVNNCQSPNTRVEMQDCVCNATLNCQGKTCGSDNCGGSCGGCLNGQTCTNGNCIGNCTNHSDCGISDFVGDLFCNSGDIKINYINFTCNHPGSTNASCSNSTILITNTTCGSNKICNGTSSNLTCISVACDSNVDCNSNNTCVNDYCNLTTNTCYRTNKDTGTCNDGNSLTINDHCSSGSCVGENVCNGNLNCESLRGETCGNCALDCGACTSNGGSGDSASSSSSNIPASNSSGSSSNANASEGSGKTIWILIIIGIVIVIGIVLFFIFSSFSNKSRNIGVSSYS